MRLPSGTVTLETFFHLKLQDNMPRVIPQKGELNKRDLPTERKRQKEYFDKRNTPNSNNKIDEYKPRQVVAVQHHVGQKLKCS